MNKKALMLGSVLAALAFAPQAMAEPDQGWYGAFDLGYHWPDDFDTKTSEPATPYRFDFELEADVAGFARLGYRLTPNWRLELEAGARAGDIEGVTGDPTRPLPNNLCSIASVLPACEAPEGSLQAYTLMGNLIWDFMPDSTLNPFVGFGVGAAKLDFQLAARANDNNMSIGIDDQDTVFAYQWLAGLSWEATERLNVDVTYRYLNTADADFDSVATSGLFEPEVFKGDYVDHSLTFGLRYAFGATAA
ncbi:MAG: porin family protein, partial [Parvibaculum sp.]|uniref:outer membrane protein n=1 Tax=Parvibaculum sp. TaxID=2024848 RepID=UPI00272FDFDC